MAFHYHVGLLPALFIKGIITVFFMGVALLEIGGNWANLNSLLEFGVMAAGWAGAVVAVAAVMRRDVSALQKQMDEGVKWRESHDKLHSDTSAIMGTLTELSRGMAQRVQRLENSQDEVQRERRTHGRE